MEKYSSLHSTLQRRIYGNCLPGKIYRSARGSKYIVQCLQQSARLKGHQGCVNTISWNDSGELLLSGSDDCHLNIYRPSSHKLLKSFKSGHGANVFSAKFLPCTGDRKIVSCAGDGKIQFADLDRESSIGQSSFNCHSGTTYEVLTTPGDPNTFLSCGEDGTVRLFDLREKTKCLCRDCKEDILIDCGKAVTSISVNTLMPYHLAIGCEDSTVRLFDRRAMSTESQSIRAGSSRISGMFCQFRPDTLAHRSCRVTSLQYSPCGNELLVSYCADYVYLFTLCSKEQTCLSSDSQERENGYHSNSQRTVPPLKRLRLRGDWSDTGPHARPESEHPSPESSLMQRMSEMFTRWLEQSFREGQRWRFQSRSISTSSSASVSSSPSYLSGGSSSESGSGAHGEEVSHPSCPQEREISVGCPLGAKSSSEVNAGAPSTVSERFHNSEASCTTSRQDREASIGCPLGTKSCSEVNSKVPSSVSERFCNSVEEPTQSRTQELRSYSNRGVNVSSSTSFDLISHSLNSEDKTRSNGTSCSSVDHPTTLVGDDTVQSHTEELTGPISPQTSEHNSSSSFTVNDDPPCPVSEGTSVARKRNRSRKCAVNNRSDGKPKQDSACDKDSMQGVAQLGERPTQVECRSSYNSTDTSHTTSSEQESVTCDSEMRDGAAVTQGQADVSETCSNAFLRVSHVESTCLDAQESVTHDSEMRDGAAVTQGQADMSETCSNAFVRVSHGESTCLDAQESVTCQSEVHGAAVSQRLSTGAEKIRGVARTRGEVAPNVDTTARQRDNDDWPSGNAERRAAATSIQRLYRRHRQMKASEYYDMDTPKMMQIYKGHRNARTMIKEANFFGDRYVLSGSDCGRIFIWDKHTAEIVVILQGDRHVVNCVQPHPFYPVFASSGIDYDIKIWEPTACEPAQLLNAEEIVRRNEKMLEESRDTLTVPASFMIRMLASLNRVMPSRDRDSDSDSSDD